MYIAQYFNLFLLLIKKQAPRSMEHSQAKNNLVEAYS